MMKETRNRDYSSFWTKHLHLYPPLLVVCSMWIHSMNRAWGHRQDLSLLMCTTPNSKSRNKKRGFTTSLSISAGPENYPPLGQHLLIVSNNTHKGSASVTQVTLCGEHDPEVEGSNPSCSIAVVRVDFFSAMDVLAGFGIHCYRMALLAACKSPQRRFCVLPSFALTHSYT